MTGFKEYDDLLTSTLGDLPMPVGMMFTGRFGEEDVLLGLAAQLEQARPWAGKRPPVHVANM